jgi:hypothetical protein
MRLCKVVPLPLLLRSNVKAKPDEASRNYATFSQNNPFIPRAKAVLSSRLHRDTRELFYFLIL